MTMRIARIVLVTKSPPKRGRVGPERLQDWHRGCQLAAKLLKWHEDNGYHDVKIVVPTAVVLGGESEGLAYHRALIALGIHENKIKIVPEGFETISQAQWVIDHVIDRNHPKDATRDDYAVVLISAWLHTPRVKKLFRRAKRQDLVEHRMAWGVPRPREAFTDILLLIIFPAIDLLGYRKQFQEWVIARRQSGKL